MTSTDKTTRQYDRWAKVYDRTFGPLLQQRLRRAIAEFDLQPGDRVLDLGVGTGVTVGFYPRDVRVTGLDLSAGMLERARRKIVANDLSHVQLVRGDAMNTPFMPQSFDHILISHVVSVVPEPGRLLRSTAQLVRPGGRVVMVNHFQSTRKTLAVLGKALNPLCKKLGWRSDLALDDVLADCPLTVLDRFKLGRMDLWQIVVLEAPIEIPQVADRLVAATA